MVGYFMVLLAVLVSAYSIGRLTRMPGDGTYTNEARSHVLVLSEGKNITVLVGENTLTGTYAIVDGRITLAVIHEGEAHVETHPLTDIGPDSFVLNGVLYTRE
jgi:hypothetical protein